MKNCIKDWIQSNMYPVHFYNINILNRITKHFKSVQMKRSSQGLHHLAFIYFSYYGTWFKCVWICEFVKMPSGQHIIRQTIKLHIWYNIYTLSTREGHLNADVVFLKSFSYLWIKNIYITGFVEAWSGYKLFAKVISRWQNMPLAGIVLNFSI